MSWKGFKKALERMPHQLQSKIRKGGVTVDPEFDDLRVRFVDLEQATKDLFVQAAKFRDSIRGMLLYQASYLEQVLAMYRPISTDPEGVSQPVGDYVDEGASAELLQVAEEFHRRVQGIKQKVDPQLGALETSVVEPVQEMLTLMKNVHKVIQKRDHKLIDYDRHRATVEKYEAKEGTDGQRRLGEEKSYQKTTAQYQESLRMYNYFNNALKEDLTQMLELRQAFIDPIFIKFFRIQHSLYSDLFREFSEAAQRCPAFDLTTPVVAAWEQKQGRVRQHLDSIDLYGQGVMIVAPLPLEEVNRGMMDTIKGTFRKKDKPAAPAVFGSPGMSSSASFRSNSSSIPPAPASGAPVAAASGPYGNYQSSLPSHQQPPPPSADVKASPYGHYDSSFPQQPSTGYPPAQQQQQQQQQPLQEKAQGYPPSSGAYGLNTNQLPPAYTSPQPEKAPVAGPSARAGPGAGAAKTTFVVALYDYAALTDGDLSFKEGDRIELVERTESKDDWWTGRLNGVSGVFPGTYVSDPK
ncbi:BAR adaptor protein Hob1 [Coemansia thaxteri]|uniref:BAR adaptor protein Hob1 n=1 Tax=Coemansia thaxteri TaxID=2663907 RepID=A0A9W8EGB5_9FUNG|nr:BAR adaptor protein Hob1 [Coemansia thaxteri]KAJ2009169.1 BAR adaptor protein Hob1 [Coemansia thaxteri]KAJ2470915.1 BAR adaptor protein Hob1 [Coemansia sp. RSA 2322]KAJ2486262.1 BAR adaptor protein Hob1 [Coemansia sp. RSA 2320]